MAGISGWGAIASRADPAVAEPAVDVAVPAPAAVDVAAPAVDVAAPVGCKARRRVLVRIFDEVLEGIDDLEATYPDPRVQAAHFPEPLVPLAPPPLPPPLVAPPLLALPPPVAPEDDIASWGAIVLVDPAVVAIPAPPAVAGPPAADASLVARVSSQRASAFTEIIVKFSAQIVPFLDDESHTDGVAALVTTQLTTGQPLLSLGNAASLSATLSVSRQLVGKYWCLMAALSWCLWLGCMREQVKRTNQVVKSLGGTLASLFLGR